MKAVPQLRASTTLQLREFYPELVRTCTQVGVALVLVAEITGARASGAGRFLSPAKALIQLSNRLKETTSSGSPSSTRSATFYCTARRRLSFISRARTLTA